MRTKHLVLIALFASTALSGCSQQAPAPIVDKGRTEFTRDKSYAVKAPIRAPRSSGGKAPVSLTPSGPTSYEAAAKVESIGVTDLQSPSAKPDQSFVTSHGEVAKIASAPPAPRGAGDRPFQSGESIYAGHRHLDSAGAVQAPVVAQVPVKANHEIAQKALDDALTAPSLTKQVAQAGMIWPVQGRLVSDFGPKGSGVVNDGVNIAAIAGTPVHAAASGRVVYAGNKIKGYGNMVLLSHAGGRNTTYAHLNKLIIAKNAKVKQGDIIGYVGDTGNVKFPQLHFAVRQGKTPVNPERLIHSSLASAN